MVAWSRSSLLPLELRSSSGSCVDGDAIRCDGLVGEGFAVFIPAGQGGAVLVC